MRRPTGAEVYAAARRDFPQARPGWFIRTNMNGRILEVRPHFMSAGPGFVFRLEHETATELWHA